MVGCRDSIVSGVPAIWAGKWCYLGGIFNEVISGVTNSGDCWIERVLGVDSSMFSIYEELVEESKKV